MANEKRLDLIDRKAFQEHIGDCYGYPAVDILHEIAIFPGVDAVEVVRCKDCKHRADLLDCGNYLCNRKMIGMVRPNDFCSFGEGREIMPEKITESQFDEITDAENTPKEFIERLKEHTGIVAKPYTAYVYYDPCDNYIGCSEVNTLRDILEEA